jgi:hypothetical protein
MRLAALGLGLVLATSMAQAEPLDDEPVADRPAAAGTADQLVLLNTA